MALAPQPDHRHPGLRPRGPEITIRTGSGSGRTLLSAFDDALLTAGVANFNLLPLSSVIPPRSGLRIVQDRLPGGHGDRLFCVISSAYAEHPGEFAWAGLGWVYDEEQGGLFVEHHAGSQESLTEQIRLSLEDMSARRGVDYGPVQQVAATAHCVDRPVCAVTIAAYEVMAWGPRG